MRKESTRDFLRVLLFFNDAKKIKDYLEQKASEVFAEIIKDGVWMEKDSLSEVLDMK